MKCKWLWIRASAKCKRIQSMPDFYTIFSRNTKWHQTKFLFLPVRFPSFRSFGQNVTVTAKWLGKKKRLARMNWMCSIDLWRRLNQNKNTFYCLVLPFQSVFLLHTFLVTNICNKKHSFLYYLNTKTQPTAFIF